MYKAWRYHKDFAPCVFEGEEAVEIAEKAGWVDSPAKVEGASDAPKDKKVADDEADADSEADKMEIEIPEDLSELTVPQLRDLCKKRGITGVSRKKEAELIALLEGK